MEYAKSDNMIKYLFQIIRVYKGSGFSFKELNTQLATCKNVGIIPILFISEENFTAKENCNEIEKTLRENCDGIYYTMYPDKDDSPIFQKEQVQAC